MILPSIKTVHLSPRLTGLSPESAISPHFSISIPIFFDCSSINDPVPAAHILFMAKSTTTPFLRLINFESCPPISKIVSTSLLIFKAPCAWAVISFKMTSAPNFFPIKYLPEPVTPTPLVRNLYPNSCFMDLRPSATTFSGLPFARIYL